MTYTAILEKAVKDAEIRLSAATSESELHYAKLDLKDSKKELKNWLKFKNWLKSQ